MATTAAATDAQVAFIVTLIGERVAPRDAVAALAWADDISTRMEAGTFTIQDAKATIRTLKAIPRA